jgi:hypothetical protein
MLSIVVLSVALKSIVLSVVASIETLQRKKKNKLVDLDENVLDRHLWIKGFRA